jgi:hypothetical protein
LVQKTGAAHWHWNPHGTWSDSSGQGYWTGSTTSNGEIINSYGYRLPHRGFTNDQANNDDYSRLDDGDTASFWKSNPYLTSAFTGESDSLHPQWALVDLGAKKPVDAIRIAWTNPYAVAYQVQYWTGSDAINNPAQGQWITFPNGNITGGTGGTVTLKLSSSTINARFMRIWMTSSSNTCSPDGSGDVRDCVGYAIDELYIGTLTGGTLTVGTPTGDILAGGNFTDYLHHVANNSQTLTYASSVDPWHQPANRVTDEEQAGLDILFTSGLTRGLPGTVAVGMLYGTPEDAVAEITYLETHGYVFGYGELGEEPDGQYILPEDYAALYVQWAAALHAFDPSLKLGGPVFQGATSDVQTWADSQGNVSWLKRFLNYLTAHNALDQLSFMSFEHYPFGPCDSSLENDLLREPGLVKGIIKTWHNDGLPAPTPLLITEYNYTANFSAVPLEITGALWHADFLGSFLTAGGAGAYLYEYEPEPLFRGGVCHSWGSLDMFTGTNQYQVKAQAAQYFSTQMVTQDWVEPVDQTHTIYPAASSIVNGRGQQIVTSYAVLRPDGQWGLLLVNKDPSNSYDVQVVFHDAMANQNHYFSGSVASVLLGPVQYVWNPMGPNGFPSPDGPPLAGTQSGGQGVTYHLPANSLTVLHAAIE